MGSVVDKTRRRAKRKDSWQFRALAATRGNQSRLGAILIAVLGNDPILEPSLLDIYGPRGMDVPRFPSGGAAGWGAHVTSDGHVLADFIDRQGRYHFGAYVSDVGSLRDNFRGLADHLKLSDRERTEMFAAVKRWIVKDWRHDSNLFEGKEQLR